MSKVTITISFNTKRDEFNFEIQPESKDVDPATLGNKAAGTLLESAMAIMSASGLAKWQIVENLEHFVGEVRDVSVVQLAKSVRVVAQQ